MIPCVSLAPGCLSAHIIGSVFFSFKPHANNFKHLGSRLAVFGSPGEPAWWDEFAFYEDVPNEMEDPSWLCAESEPTYLLLLFFTIVLLHYCFRLIISECSG
jgi:hypothetical protein